jgi:hypothetical protein
LKEGTGWRCFLYFKNTVWLAYVKGQCHREDFGMKNTKDKGSSNNHVALNLIFNKSRSYVKILLHLLCRLLCFSVFNKPKNYFRVEYVPKLRVPAKQRKEISRDNFFEGAVAPD